MSFTFIRVQHTKERGTKDRTYVSVVIEIDVGIGFRIRANELVMHVGFGITPKSITSENLIQWYG